MGGGWGRGGGTTSGPMRLKAEGRLEGIVARVKGTGRGWGACQPVGGEGGGGEGVCVCTECCCCSFVQEKEGFAAPAEARCNEYVHGHINTHAALKSTYTCTHASTAHLAQGTEIRHVVHMHACMRTTHQHPHPHLHSRTQAHSAPGPGGPNLPRGPPGGASHE